MSNNISKIILGSAQFGLNYGIASKNEYLNSITINKILSYAYAQGINSIDTAKNYGDSEKKIGEYLSKNINQKWKIITKVNSNKSKLVHQLEESKQKTFLSPSILMSHSLDLFVSDLYQEDLVLCKEKYSSLKFGVSVYDEKEIEQAISCRIKPEVIQVPLNILDKRLYNSNIIYECKKLGIEVHARSIFLQGLFFLSDAQIKKQFNDAFPALWELKKIGKKYGLTLSELSLLWVNNINFIDKLIIGVDNLKQLKMNVEVLRKKNIVNFSDEILNVIYENENILNPQKWEI